MESWNQPSTRAQRTRELSPTGNQPAKAGLGVEAGRSATGQKPVVRGRKGNRESRERLADEQQNYRDDHRSKASDFKLPLRQQGGETLVLGMVGVLMNRTMEVVINREDGSDEHRRNHQHCQHRFSGDPEGK